MRSTQSTHSINSVRSIHSIHCKLHALHASRARALAHMRTTRESHASQTSHASHALPTLQASRTACITRARSHTCALRANHTHRKRRTHRTPCLRCVHACYTQSYISKGIRRQGIGSFVRNSFVLTPRPPCRHMPLIYAFLIHDLLLSFPPPPHPSITGVEGLAASRRDMLRIRSARPADSSQLWYSPFIVVLLPRHSLLALHAARNVAFGPDVLKSSRYHANKFSESNFEPVILRRIRGNSW